jgi:hypothetical protein
MKTVEAFLTLQGIWSDMLEVNFILNHTRTIQFHCVHHVADWVDCFAIVCLAHRPYA